MKAGFSFAWVAKVVNGVNAARNRRRRTPPDDGGAVGFARLATIEGLESRVLRTVVVDHNTTTNTLTITGDVNDNTIFVFQQHWAGSDTIGVDISGQASEGPFTVNGDLTLVKVLGQGGADDISFGSATYGVGGASNAVAVSVPAEIHGGDGNDVQLTGTDNADTIWGDGGADTLKGADGADIMYGGYGSSTNHDNSNDVLWGDGGADSMWGEDGNDTFHATDGIADYLDGGAGSDTATDRDKFGSPQDTTISIEIL